MARRYSVSRRTVTAWCSKGFVLHAQRVGGTWVLQEPFRVFSNKRDCELYRLMLSATHPLSLLHLHGVAIGWHPQTLLGCIKRMLLRKELVAIWRPHYTAPAYMVIDRAVELTLVADEITTTVVAPERFRPKKKRPHKPVAPPPPIPTRMNFAELALHLAETNTR